MSAATRRALHGADIYTGNAPDRPTIDGLDHTDPAFAAIVAELRRLFLAGHDPHDPETISRAVAAGRARTEAP